MAALRRLAFLLVLGCVAFESPFARNSPPENVPVAAVSVAFGSTNFLAAKLALDKSVDPATDAEIVEKEVDQLITAARIFAGDRSSEGAKLDAVRKVLYESGPWNGNRPFTYDQSDPLGENVHHKLLSHYLKSRLGNCVTMPTLFMIVGRGIGLNLTLTTAPLHVLVRYTRPGLHPFNIEATSGGGFARDEWYRQQFPMSDRAIESGLYLRTHTEKESIAVMATTVLDYLASVGRNEEAVKVADAILTVDPKEGYTMVKKGSAIAAIMKAEFYDKYPTPALIPAVLRPRYLQLATDNKKAFEEAQALGWEPAS